MHAAPPPFLPMSPAQFVLLTAKEKSDYLVGLTIDLQKRVQEFHEGNKRLVEWVLHKDDLGGGK